jgi:hypothetical protein
MRLPSGSILSLALFLAAPAFAVEPFCKDDLKPGPRELSDFDADAIARKIDSKKLSLKQVDSQDVSRVIGLARGKSYIVRMEGSFPMLEDFGIKAHGFDLRTRVKRDVATGVLDRLLGFNLVPEIKLTRIAGKAASIQVEVGGDRVEFMSAAHYQPYVTKTIRRNPETALRHKAELERMAVLDIISGNTDRNITNFIYDETRGRIWAIDHADTFPLVEKSPGNHWFWLHWAEDLAGPLEPALRAKILALDAKSLAEKMRRKNLLEEAALSAMVRRISLLQADVITHPEASMREIGGRIERLIVQFGSGENRP